VDGQILVLPGTGELVPGERALLLLRNDPSGPPRIVDFALGKFHLGPTEDGNDAAWRDDLFNAFALGLRGPYQERLRDAAIFERWIEEVSRGRLRPAAYFRDAWKPKAMVSAEFNLLKVNGFPARREEFEQNQSITYKDNSAGPAGSACPDFHAATAEGLVAWNTISDTMISLVYGGTDGTIGSKCFNNGALDNEINYDDPCNEIGALSGCTGALAIGGFSASLGETSHACPEKGGTFYRIVSGAIVTNSGVGNCLNCCDFEDMIAHETGHTIGFGHSTDSSALMAPFIVSGRCGLPQADDILGAKCVYPGCTKTITAVLVVETNPANVKLKVLGVGFHKGDLVQIDGGSGFQTVPVTVFKSKTKLLAKHVEGLFPDSSTVQVRVTGACDSNALSSSR
jgi:hypothetical protein